MRRAWSLLPLLLMQLTLPAVATGTGHAIPVVCLGLDNALAKRVLPAQLIRLASEHYAPGVVMSCPRGEVAPASTGAPGYRLDIYAGPLHQGPLPRGFSFTLGDGDPRAAGFDQATLLAITCRLRDSRGTLLDMHKSEAVMPIHAPTAAMIISAVSEACQVSDSGVQPGENPQVSTPAVTKATAMDAAPRLQEKAGSGDTIHLQRIPAGRRTQYIIHNKGDDLILERGRSR